MFVIIGAVIVSIAVAGGYVYAGGPLGVLVQPGEFVIIFGASIGALAISCPKKYLGNLAHSITSLVRPSTYSDESFMELLRMLYELFSSIRKRGLLSLEKDISEPESSELFTRYPSFMQNHHAVEYLTDALSYWLATNAKPYELDHYLETSMETHEEEHVVIPGLLQKVGDALPGFGIVAAVLGIVVTMQHLDGPPEELGQHVAAALIGTFLGILMAYGFVNPMASNLEISGKDQERYFSMIKVALLAFAQGSAPSTAVELARKVIFSMDRPTSTDLNNALKLKS